LPCGKELWEFPIVPGNNVYNGGNVVTLPDRVIFEYAANKKTNQAKLKYCGVIRHGPPPGNAFFKCS